MFFPVLSVFTFLLCQQYVISFLFLTSKESSTKYLIIITAGGNGLSGNSAVAVN